MNVRSLLTALAATSIITGSTIAKEKPKSIEASVAVLSDFNKSHQLDFEVAYKKFLDLSVGSSILVKGNEICQTVNFGVSKQFGRENSLSPYIMAQIELAPTDTQKKTNRDNISYGARASHPISTKANLGIDLRRTHYFFDSLEDDLFFGPFFSLKF